MNIDNAIEELQTTGFLSDETLRGLNPDEYLLVLERAGAA